MVAHISHREFFDNVVALVIQCAKTISNRWLLNRRERSNRHIKLIVIDIKCLSLNFITGIVGFNDVGSLANLLFISKLRLDGVEMTEFM